MRTGCIHNKLSEAHLRPVMRQSQSPLMKKINNTLKKKSFSNVEPISIGCEDITSRQSRIHEFTHATGKVQLANYMPSQATLSVQ